MRNNLVMSACLLIAILLSIEASCVISPPISPVSNYSVLSVVDDAAPYDEYLRTVYVYPQWVRYHAEELPYAARFECYLKAGGSGPTDRLERTTQEFSIRWSSQGFEVTWYVDEYRGLWVEAYCLNDYDLLENSALVGRWYVQ